MSQGNHQPPKRYISQTITTRRHVSGGASESCQDTPPLGGTPREGISCQGNDTWARRPAAIKKTSCRGQGHVGRRAHEWYTSQGQGHLHARTPDEGAHLRTRTPLEGHVTCVIAGYLYQPRWMNGISPEPNSSSATLYLYLSTSPRLFSHLGFLFYVPLLYTSQRIIYRINSDRSVKKFITQAPRITWVKVSEGHTYKYQ